MHAHGRLAPFRLAVYTEAYERGGAEMNLKNVLSRLPAQIELHVIGPEPELLNWLAGDRPGVTTHRVEPIRSRSELANMWSHRKLFSTIDADIIQFQLAMMPAAQWALLVAQLRRGQRTLVVENATMGTWSTLSLRLKQLTSKRATAHISVGQQSSRIIERLGGLEPDSVGTLYHGVPDVRHDAAPPAEGTVRVVNIARHDPVKGVDVLIDAIAACADDVVLQQYGSGTETERLHAQVEALGLGERVTITEPDWAERIADRVWEHDIFVLPSRTESMPVSIMEAMLAGVPVITTDVGSVREAVEHGVTGLVVPPEDPAALAEAIEELRSPQRRAQMGAQARQVALERFSIDATVEAYCALFSDMLRR